MPGYVHGLTCFDPLPFPDRAALPDPTAQPTNSPSKSPTKSPAPAPTVANGCHIGIGTYQDTLTPQPAECVDPPGNPDICCMDTTNIGLSVQCENTCQNCGAGPTEESCCDTNSSSGCGTNEYCCHKTEAAGPTQYECRAFGTSCGIQGGQTDTKYAVDKDSGQICLKTETIGSEGIFECSP